MLSPLRVDWMAVLNLNDRIIILLIIIILEKAAQGKPSAKYRPTRLYI